MNRNSDKKCETDHASKSPDDLWYPSLITSLSSPYGQQLLSSSSHFTYDKLLSCFEPQERSDFCGVASATILLNTLRPDRKWNQSTLYETIAQDLMTEGMTLSQLSDVLHECGISSISRYCQNEDSEDQFRQDINAKQNLVIVNYWRQYEEDKENNIQRSGHFSPVGGFHEETDQVLIMDTFQPKFSHHWLGVKHLMRMMYAEDEKENAPRGYLIVVDEVEK